MNKRSKRSFKKGFVFMAALLLLAAFGWWQNNDLVITNLDYENLKVPSDFHGFRVVHISDLHNKTFGKDQSKLLRQVADQSPDIIVVTGDLIDRRRFDLEPAMDFINGAVEMAPTYFVSGNHEAWSGKYEQVKERLLAAGVQVIDDTALQLTKETSAIRILGLSDPAFLTSDYLEESNSQKMEEQLKQWANNETATESETATENEAQPFKILLSHRPELFHLYYENNIDLTFSGHAHGGQFRFPFLGGLVAPNQGLFPQYTSGSYTHQESTMVVSRGLGNSVIPIRIFNRPEIVVVTLKSK